MKVLITGITGFAGSHLAEYGLTQDGVEVYGTCRWRSRLDNLQDLAGQGKLNNLVEERIETPQALARLARPPMRFVWSQVGQGSISPLILLL